MVVARAFGASRFGSRTYSGQGPVSFPSVSLVAPTVEQAISTGGPLVTVDWTYTQAESLPQAFYRVSWWNDAGDTMYADTGWLSGSVGELEQDLVALGVPTDSADVSVRVDVQSSPGQFFRAEGTLTPVQMQWGVPSVVITEPDPEETVASQLVTAEWTFASTRSKTQAKFRVTLRTMAGGLIHDSGWVDGADDSYQVPAILANNARYLLGVRVENSEGVLS